MFLSALLHPREAAVISRSGSPENDVKLLILQAEDCFPTGREAEVLFRPAGALADAGLVDQARRSSSARRTSPRCGEMCASLSRSVLATPCVSAMSFR